MSPARDGTRATLLGSNIRTRPIKPEEVAQQYNGSRSSAYRSRAASPSYIFVSRSVLANG